MTPHTNLATCNTLLDEMFAESKVDKRAIKLMFKAIAFNVMMAERERCVKACDDDAFVDQWKGLAEAKRRILDAI